ncbi:scoloptoxin SSD552-like [Tribolium madens]|uniref:scoloptoxin SSD552-like n=1 Tax=Tribolium madens TaxID=41895 RepID=UPI001CF76033|nr:scoloptoxin SSD552-like [Tribolium madens]XP_044262961.1 scoloptoxin SSD552-like [Tribolium madens]
MFRSILFFAVFLCVYGADKYDPKKVNYCKMKCMSLEKSTGCDCKQQGTRREQLRNMVSFRQVCVDEHNKLRNLLASGNETRGFAKSAANMMVMNYDLELEYLARCYGRSTFRGIHDRCRKMSTNRESGQNLAGIGIPDPSLNRVIIMIRDNWYEEVKLMTDMYAKFDATNVHDIGHFTTMSWWCGNIIGCARVYADAKADKYINPVFAQALICNYASKDVNGKESFINLPGMPIYIAGPPCTKCWKNQKCNTKYTSLCGELEPVPTDKPFDFESKAPKHNSILIVIFIASLVLRLF